MQWLVTFFTVHQMVLKLVGWVENTAGHKKQSWTKIIKAIQGWNKFKRIQVVFRRNKNSNFYLTWHETPVNITVDKVHYNQNAFPISKIIWLRFVFKSFRQVKMIKGQTWFEIMTNRFVVYARRSCSSLLSVR